MHDLAGKADPEKLAGAAAFYDNSAVRRLGFLLDYFGYEAQAQALMPYARRAKSMKPLDPSIKPLIEGLDEPSGGDRKWMLRINEPVELEP